MNQPEFVYVTFIATTPEKLWAALTNPEFTQQYWFNQYNPEPYRLESDWQIGSPIRLYDTTSQALAVSGEVLECDPPKRLSYTFAANSRVNFTLEPVGSAVKLTLVHDRVQNQESANGFGKAWMPILCSLKSYLETGRALPWT